MIAWSILVLVRECGLNVYHILVLSNIHSVFSCFF